MINLPSNYDGLAIPIPERVAAERERRPIREILGSLASYFGLVDKNNPLDNALNGGIMFDEKGRTIVLPLPQSRHEQDLY